MYSACFKTWSDFTAQNLAQWKKLNQTAFAIAGSLLQTQVELAAALTDVAAYHADNIATAKDASEIASRQFGLAEESSKILMETAHSTAEILTEAGKTYSKLFENSLASASAFTANTQKAQKSAA
jgi:hypothetical protein